MRIRTKMLVGIGATLLLPLLGLILLVVVGYGYFVYDIYTHTEDLEKSNVEKFIFCKNIANNPKFTSGPVDFRLDNGSNYLFNMNLIEKRHNRTVLAYTTIIPMFQKTIFLTPRVLEKENCLDVFVAHELGHIETRVGISDLFESKESREQKANAFAAELFGIPHVLSCILPP